MPNIGVWAKVPGVGEFVRGSKLGPLVFQERNICLPTLREETDNR